MEVGVQGQRGQGKGQFVGITGGCQEQGTADSDFPDAGAAGWLEMQAVRMSLERTCPGEQGGEDQALPWGGGEHTQVTKMVLEPFLAGQGGWDIMLWSRE